MHHLQLRNNQGLDMKLLIISYGTLNNFIKHRSTCNFELFSRTDVGYIHSFISMAVERLYMYIYIASQKEQTWCENTIASTSAFFFNEITWVSKQILIMASHVLIFLSKYFISPFVLSNLFLVGNTLILCTNFLLTASLYFMDENTSEKW